MMHGIPMFYGLAAALCVLWQRHRLKKKLGFDPVLFSELKLSPSHFVHRSLAWLSLLMLALAALSVLAPGFFALPALLFLPEWLSNCLVISLSSLAFFNFLVSFFTLGASWRMGQSEARAGQLITAGIYRYIRHPIYTSLILAFPAIFLLAPNGLAAIVASLGVYACLVLARLEEEFLLRLHGESYRSYMRQTGRFFPFVGVLS